MFWCLLVGLVGFDAGVRCGEDSKQYQLKSRVIGISFSTVRSYDIRAFAGDLDMGGNNFSFPASFILVDELPINIKIIPHVLTVFYPSKHY